MIDQQVHYELFVRRRPGSSWTLDLAGEDRGRVLESAEEILRSGGAAAVRVSKETLDPETREYRSVVILTKGEIHEAKVRKVREDKEPLCVSPSDLYTGHARERIGRLLDGWLLRQRATPFELLHRPDLVERLDAAGVELQHAIQKIAIPEAQDRGLSVHELIRSFQTLVERAVARVLKDARRKAFPDLSREAFADAARRVCGDPEQGYLLGGAVAGALAKAVTWSGKVERLLDLADAAPGEGPARKLALQVLEQPLAEILGGRAGLTELLGEDLDLGQQLAAMTRLASAEAVETLISEEPQVAALIPALGSAAARLANWLDGPHFESVRVAIAQRVLRELSGPRRLKPANAEAEIVALRALAMILTAASGRMLAIDDLHEAFTSRSQLLVASAFVDCLVAERGSAREEARSLIYLAENVTGAANKRQACRWLGAQLNGLKFETEALHGQESPAARLAAMAELQRALGHAKLVEEDRAPLHARLGELGSQIEADAQLLAAIGRSPAGVVQKLGLLLRLAMGEAAPLGPAADRARHEALKLIRNPALREQISSSPATLAKVRGLLQSAA